MLECKVDWFSVSIIPNQIIDSERLYIYLLKALKLERYESSFKKCYGGLHHIYCMRYKNIGIYFPDPFTMDHTGFKVEFTGQGVDFYIEHMQKFFSDYNVVNLIAFFLALAETGEFKINIPRIDVAVDDISYEEKKYYKLDLNLIKKALEKHEFTSPWAVKREYERFMVTLVNSEKSKGDCFLGKTLYLGNRKCNTFCRLYDKLAQLKSKRQEVDPDIKHWSRMEFEFKNGNALAICNKLVELSETDFGTYFAEVVNDYIRFVVVKNKDDLSHICRCPSKRWWSSFVGTVKKAKLVHRKPESNEFIRSEKWLEKTCYPTIGAILEVKPVDQFLFDVKKSSKEHPTQKHDEIVNDFIEAKEIVSEPPGLERYSLYTDDFDKLLVELKRKQTKNEIRFILNDLLDSDPCEVEEAVNDVDNLTDEQLLLDINCRSSGTYLDEISCFNIKKYNDCG